MKSRHRSKHGMIRLLAIAAVCAVFSCLLSGCGKTADGSKTDDIAAKMVKEADASLDRIEKKNDISLSQDETIFRSSAKKISGLPSSYDLRDKGLVTPVKQQSPWNSCWAFGTAAAAETSMLASDGTTYEKSGLDLSERHLALNAFSGGGEGGVSIFEGKGTGAYPDSKILDTGGLPIYSASLFASGEDPVSEKQAPYRNRQGYRMYNRKLGTSYWSPDGDWTLEDKDYTVDHELQDANFLASPASWKNGKYHFDSSANDSIKKELYEGRGVAVCFHAENNTVGSNASEKYMNRKTWSQYTYDSVSANHTAEIVGWDDDYPAEKFKVSKDGKCPPHDGAWIVKNSWGSSSGSFPDKNNWGSGGSGYFYLSYYDKSICLLQSYSFSRSESGVSTLQHDGMLPNDVTSVDSDDETKSAAVFSADSDLEIKSVMTETSRPGMTVKFSIYELEDGYSDPEDGELIASGSAKPEYAGYHRIKLGETVNVSSGKHFSVVVTQKREGKYYLTYNKGYSVKAYKNLESSNSGARCYSRGVVDKGTSFVFDGEWRDWSEVVSSVGEKTDVLVEYDDFPIKVSVKNRE